MRKVVNFIKNPSSELRTPNSELVHKTTPEDLVDKVIEGDVLFRIKNGFGLSKFRPSQRVWIEPFFNFAGLAFGGLTRLMPLRSRMGLNLWICRKLEKRHSAENPGLAACVSETQALAEKIYRVNGIWPALVIATSHPPTVGDLEWLRFEIVRQGLIVADAVSLSSPNPRLPQCFQAIDPFALDTLPPWLGGFYAGYAHSIFLSWDRQTSTQSLPQSILLRRSGHDRIAWRTLNRLKNDMPVLMALSGGLPHNARMFYTAREFIRRLPIKKSVSRLQTEWEFMDLLLRADPACRPTEEGKLSPAAEDAVRAFLVRFGIDPVGVERLLAEFSDELQYEVPYRERFLRFLKNRLLDRGKPLILVGIAHQTQVPWIRLSEPWAMQTSPQGIARIPLNGPQQTYSTVRDWAKAFHRSAFTGPNISA
jgi:hypothetical protein